MALIRCKGCGQQISSRAKICPKCGCISADEDQRLDSSSEMDNSPGETSSAADTAPIDHNKSEVFPPNGQEENVEDWYYVSSSGRSGPVTLGSLHKLAAAGHIDGNTSVWKAGMPDWIALSRHQEVVEDPIPAAPPAADKSLPKIYIWALVLAPIWGTILQIVATELWVLTTKKQLSYYSQLWWIMIIANLTASYLDSVRLKKSGQDLTINKWMFLLVPAYIYLRDKRVMGRLIWVWVWIGSLLLSLAAYLYLNGIYARLSSR